MRRIEGQASKQARLIWSDSHRLLKSFSFQNSQWTDGTVESPVCLVLESLLRIIIRNIKAIPIPILN